MHYSGKRIDGIILRHRMDARDFFAFQSRGHNPVDMGEIARARLYAFIGGRIASKGVIPYLYTFICHGGTWPVLDINGGAQAAMLDSLETVFAAGPHEGSLYQIISWKGSVSV